MFSGSIVFKYTTIVTINIIIELYYFIEHQQWYELNHNQLFCYFDKYIVSVEKQNNIVSELSIVL